MPECAVAGKKSRAVVHSSPTSSWQHLQRLTHGRHLQLLRRRTLGRGRHEDVLTRAKAAHAAHNPRRQRGPHGGEKAAGEAARDDGTCLSANSIATLDALVDELCSAEVLEALLVADEIEAQRELVIDAMRDAYDLW